MSDDEGAVGEELERRDDLGADEGMAASAGLSYEQVKGSLDAFVGNTLRCVPDGGIAATLDLSINTVAVHRANIMNELGVHKTAELVVYAIRHGLVPPP